MMDGLKVLDEKELVVDVEKMEEFQKLERGLAEAFEGEVDIETIPKR